MSLEPRNDRAGVLLTRPLDLAARLRPAPRSFDTLFYVNVALIAVFFSLAGSRFILAPGLGVDFHVPEMNGAVAGAAPTERVISVLPSGQIFADGLLNLPQLQVWLKAEAGRLKQPSLLVRASAGVPLSEIAAITSAARSAGFVRVVVAAEEPPQEAGSPVDR
jgi:biopolymer transport protein ExbD